MRLGLILLVLVFLALLLVLLVGFLGLNYSWLKYFWLGHVRLGHVWLGHGWLRLLRGRSFGGGSNLISSGSSLISSSLDFSGSGLSLIQYADQLIPLGLLSVLEAGLVALLLALRRRLGLFRCISIVRIVATVLRVVWARSTSNYFFEVYLTFSPREKTLVLAMKCLRI